MNDRIRPRLTAALGLLLAFVFALPSARADIVVMRDGRRIEGKIVREDATELEIRMRIGSVTVQRADVVDIVRQKTKDELYEEQLEAAESADDFFALGNWCVENRMRRRSERAWERAIELDPQHAGAHTALGHVEHEGEWMTPEERDARIEAAREAEMRERGLVQHEGRWVTEEERDNLERGLVLHEGEWMTPAAARLAQGYVQYEDQWVREAVLGVHTELDRLQQSLGRELTRVTGEEWVLAGPLSKERLERIQVGMHIGRLAFAEAYGLEPGAPALGGAAALFLAAGSDSSVYLSSIDHLATLTNTLPPGWAEAVRNSHGFVYYDPIPVSSARLWNREEADLDGHCYHHLGQVLGNRLGYDGKLLPPWYEEGLAALVEYWSHGKNRVFNRARSLQRTGESVGGRPIATGNYDPRGIRSGEWRVALASALEVNAVSTFDRLSRLDFSELELTDAAAAMAILSWMAETGEPGALARFHGVIKATAPSAPARLLQRGRPSYERWDRAFQEAMGLNWREADRTWREWIRNR